MSAKSPECASEGEETQDEKELETESENGEATEDEDENMLVTTDAPATAREVDSGEAGGSLFLSELRRAEGDGELELDASRCAGSQIASDASTVSECDGSDGEAQTETPQESDKIVVASSKEEEPAKPRLEVQVCLNTWKDPADSKLPDSRLEQPAAQPRATAEYSCFGPAPIAKRRRTALVKSTAQKELRKISASKPTTKSPPPPPDKASPTGTKSTPTAVEKVFIQEGKEPIKLTCYTCPVDGCGKWFYDASALRKHGHVHGEKQFVCNYKTGDAVCGKRFVDGSKLKRHQLIHTGEKKFVCTVQGCGKAFSLDFNLRSHVKTHASKNYFVCTWGEGCTKRFAHDYKLSSHLRQHQDKVESVKRKATRAAERAERQADVKKQKQLRDSNNKPKPKLDHTTTPPTISDHDLSITAGGRQPDDDATFTLGTLGSLGALGENALTEEEEQPDTQSESEAADGSGEVSGDDGDDVTDEEAQLLEPLGASTSPSRSRLPYNSVVIPILWSTL